MKVRLFTLAAKELQGLGALGESTQIDQEIELPITDDARIEITLDSGAVVMLSTITHNSFNVNIHSLYDTVFLRPATGNSFDVVIPSP